MRKILITGGLGYIGSVLLKRLLLNEENTITVLDNLSNRQIGSVYDVGNKRVNFVNGDVRDEGLLKTLVNRHDVIIPLAAIVGAPACKKYPTEATDINHIQIKNIVHWICRDQMIIMPNTNSQYGSSKDIITENSPMKPLSKYAETKCLAEDEILQGGNGIALRLATVFGVSPRMRLDLLVNNFTYKAYTDGYLVLFESHFKRNYIHIEDVARTFEFMIDNYNHCKNQAFNVGLSSANLTKLELANAIKIRLPKLVIKEEEFTEDPDKRDYIVSNEKLEKLGWVPMWTIDNGIEQLLKAFSILKPYNDKQFTNL